MKRLFDVIFALILGVLLAPVLVVIATALKITSPGPLLFRQKRLGKDGKTFLMNKFRKFPADWGDQGPGVTLHQDSRMTKIGEILERTKLDELPQLWNIVLGEMSFVGPRPESLKFKHLFVGKYSDVLKYTPGIFGPNQTKYRNESAMYPHDEDPHTFYEKVLFPDKVKNDLAYFKRANFLSDLWCIVSGVFALVFSVVIWRKSMRASLIMLAWDVLSILGAWMATHWLKYSVSSTASIRPAALEVLRAGFFIVPVALIVVFAVARVYRHPVRYFSRTDFYRLAGATCATWIVSAVTIGFFINSTSSMLLAVVCLISIFLMVLPRLTYREWHGLMSSGRRRSVTNDSINVLVCGVSERSIALCSLFKSYSDVHIVGLLSEDVDQIRQEVHGFEVVGRAADLTVLDARYTLNQIWADNSLEPVAVAKIDTWCSDNGIPLVMLDSLPGFQSLSPGKSGSPENNHDVTTPLLDDAAPTSKEKRAGPRIVEIQKDNVVA